MLHAGQVAKAMVAAQLARAFVVILVPAIAPQVFQVRAPRTGDEAVYRPRWRWNFGFTSACWVHEVDLAHRVAGTGLTSLERVVPQYGC
jgi:hypothetical protein